MTDRGDVDWVSSCTLEILRNQQSTVTSPKHEYRADLQGKKGNLQGGSRSGETKLTCSLQVVDPEQSESKEDQIPRTHPECWMRRELGECL